MKLTALFARYLFQHRELRLPGIGVFYLDEAAEIPEPGDRNAAAFQQHIRYRPEPVTAPDPAFIDFIRMETGKIKPLAESDLDSYLNDGKLLLNIGKPFYIEGVGTIQKNWEGTLAFSPGVPSAQRPDQLQIAMPADEISRIPPAYPGKPQPSGVGQKGRLVVAFALVLGIALVIWGGYSLYNRNVPGTQPVPTPAQEAVAETTPPDTNASVVSQQTEPAAPAALANHFRFVIEVTERKTRALNRFRQIRGLGEDIRMETPDSLRFSLFFVLPASPADTARIRDSLRSWYARPRVFVEPVVPARDFRN